VKDIYSPLEIDEEWDNFAPVDTAEAPAPAAPGAQIVPEANPASVKVAVAPETEAPAVAAGGTPPPNDPPNSNVLDPVPNTKDAPSTDISEFVKQEGADNAQADMDQNSKALPTTAPITDGNGAAEMSNDMAADADNNKTAVGLDMDTISTDPAREAAMNAMGGTETSKAEPEPEPLNKDEIIAKWGGENTADTSDSDTLEMNEIGGTAKNEANAPAETENKNDADNPVAIKVPVGEDDMPKPEEDVNPMLVAEMDNTKAEKPSSPDNDAIAGAVENLLKAIEDKIGELENGLEAANKEKTVLDQQVQENASSIEGMQKDLADLKAQYDKAKDMAPNGPL